METITQKVAIGIFWCSECNSPIALTNQQYQRHKENGTTFWCSAGHSQIFTQSENQKLAEAQGRVTFLETKVRNTEGMLTAEVKKRRRLEKRVNNGVCIHCHRTFQQLARHVKSKHPEVLTAQ